MRIKNNTIYALAATLLLTGCDACRHNGSGCDLLVIEAAMPIILPAAIVIGTVNAAKSPFDPVYPTFATSQGNKPALANFPAPFSITALTITDTATVTINSGMPFPGWATCALNQSCIAASPPEPLPPSTCAAISPNRKYCVDITKSGRILVALPAGTPLASPPNARLNFGTFETASNQGEIFTPTTDGGYNRTTKAATIHAAPNGARIVAMARLGTTGRFLQLTGALPNALTLNLRAGNPPQGRAHVALPADIRVLMAFQLSEDGTWCAITYAPGGKSQRTLLYRITSTDIRLAGTIVSPVAQARLAFAPSGNLLAVAVTGAHDQKLFKRVSIFQLTD